MEKFGLNRATYNLIDRLNDNVSRVADELERLNNNLEDD